MTADTLPLLEVFRGSHTDTQVVGGSHDDDDASATYFYIISDA